MLLKIYDTNPNPVEIRRVVEVLRKGGIIIFPTDGVYSFGCNIFNPAGVEFISRLKNKDLRKSELSFICYEMSQISEYAKMDDVSFKLIKKNLPGPVTFILNGSSKLPKLFKNKKTVGIRIPDNLIPVQIVKALGHPIMSASIHDEDEIIEYMSDPELIYEKYQDLVDIVIDGGYGSNEVSTIIDCTSGDPEIIRQGKGILF